MKVFFKFFFFIVGFIYSLLAINDLYEYLQVVVIPWHDHHLSFFLWLSMCLCWWTHFLLCCKPNFLISGEIEGPKHEWLLEMVFGCLNIRRDFERLLSNTTMIPIYKIWTNIWIYSTIRLRCARGQMGFIGFKVIMPSPGCRFAITFRQRCKVDRTC